MKYISEIILDTGSSVSRLHYRPGRVFSVRVYDMETGKESLISSKEMRRVKLIGVAPTGDDNEYIALCHSLKTASLYKHIPLVTTEVVLSSTVDLRKVDTCYIDIDDIKYKLQGYDTLILQLLQDPNIDGLCGSVASLSYEFLGLSEFYTLYDFLGVLCKKSKLNLMRYDAVYMFCKTYGTIGIRFSHTVEANRFFAKMYLDICGSNGSDS